MIILSQVTKLQAGSAVLREANMVLPRGSYTHIQADSDTSGASLFQLLLGYEQPDRGTVRVCDIDISQLSHGRASFLRRNIGLLEYNPTLMPNRSVAENIAMPLQIAGFDRKALLERIADKIEQAGLEDHSSTLVQALTTEEKQLVACARATVHKPQIILADEPGQGLDHETTELIFGMLENANHDGATVVVASVQSQPARSFTHSMQIYRGSLAENASRKVV